MQLASVYDWTGSSSAPSARKPASTVWTLFVQSRPLAHAEHLLHPVVVRRRGRRRRTARRASFVRPVAGCHFATSRSWARSATFVLIVVVPPTQRPARKASISPFGSGASRSGQKRSCVAFASQRVKSAAVRCGPDLEQQHVAAALRELARDDAAAGARADHDDVEVVLHAIPRYDQSLREARRERRVEVDLGPRARPLLARGDEVAVVRLDRERPDERELGRPLVLGERLGTAVGRGRERVDRRQRVRPRARAASRSAPRRRRRRARRGSSRARTARRASRRSRPGLRRASSRHLVVLTRHRRSSSRHARRPSGRRSGGRPGVSSAPRPFRS